MKKCMRLAVCVALSAAWGVCGQTLYGQTNSFASGNWNSTGTWTAGIPTDTSSATINGGHTVTLDQVGAITNLLDVGTIADETGNINISGELTVFDSDEVTEPNTSAIRLGQVAGSTGNLTMSGGQVFISEDSDSIDEFNDGDLVIGQSGTGTATITDGTLTAADEVFIGQDPGSNGTLNISGGTLNAARRSLQVGFSGTGTLNISGTGVINHAGLLFSSFNPGSTSTINQTGGTINASAPIVIGRQGDSTYNHSGGLVDIVNVLVVADNFPDGLPPDHPGITATYNISAGATLDVGNIMWLGAFGGGHGIVNQTGGSVTTGATAIGRDGMGTYNLSDGTYNLTGMDGFTPNNHFVVGQVGNIDDNIAQGTGFFNQTGGTVTIATGVFLGDYDSSEGTYRISGGTLNVTGTGSHPNPGPFEDFIGDFSVGGALASNAELTRVEPDGTPCPGTAGCGAQGQALGANGTLIVSGSAATIDIAGNFLANPADKSSFRSDPFIAGADNSATLGFEIFDNSGTSLIDVAGVADLDGAVIDLDLMSGFTPAINATFDLLKASSFGSTGTGTTQNVGTGEGFSLATEDAGGWSLAVVAGGGFETLRATFLGLVSTPGDFDNDGDVDGRDFLLWQRNPGVGNLSDWQANYGNGGLASIGSVPEPTSFALLSMLGVCAFVVRRRKATR
jgi:T5SS/PEP-CTERM-associated repeat protein